MKKFILLAISVLLTVPLLGQLSYPGCADVTSDDFNVIDLITFQEHSLTEPLKMAFDMDDQNNVDVYWVEKRGKVRRYRNGNVQDLATIDVFWDKYSIPGRTEDIEEGLVGIALDPKFKDNHYIYLFYSPAGNEDIHRLARFTLTGNSLDLNSIKILLDIPTQREFCCHSGGAMAFDAYGDLWVTVGNNTANAVFIDESVKGRSDEWGSSSTGGLRGGIFRIHPDESEKGYSIPAGNFAEYYADYFENLGDSVTAAEYRDTSKVLPEIYVKGTRNAYSIALDPVRRWMAFGDIGPDFGGMTEEYTLTTHPIFAGWPYWSGNQVVNQHIPEGLRKTDPNNPINNSKWNNGVQKLPPATPATIDYNRACAVTGPIYQYDGSSSSTVKWPPHFHRKWILSDCNMWNLRYATPTEDGSGIEGQVQHLMHGLREPVDVQQGPDGAVYVINYSTCWFCADSATTIKKIEYTGNCHPSTPVPEYVACMDSNYLEYDPNAHGHDSTQCLTTVGIDKGLNETWSQYVKMNLTPNGLLIHLDLPGEHTVETYNLNGQLLFQKKGRSNFFIPTKNNRNQLQILKIYNNQQYYQKMVLLK